MSATRRAAGSDVFKRSKSIIVGCVRFTFAWDIVIVAKLSLIILLGLGERMGERTCVLQVF